MNNLYVILHIIFLSFLFFGDTLKDYFSKNLRIRWRSLTHDTFEDKFRRVFYNYRVFSILSLIGEIALLIIYK